MKAEGRGECVYFSRYLKPLMKHEAWVVDITDFLIPYNNTKENSKRIVCLISAIVLTRNGEWAFSTFSRISTCTHFVTLNSVICTLLAVEHNKWMPFWFTLSSSQVTLSHVRVAFVLRSIFMLLNHNWPTRKRDKSLRVTEVDLLDFKTLRIDADKTVQDNR